MCFGTSRRGDSGYTGLSGPVNLYVGNGWNTPVSGSGLEMTFGAIKWRRGLPLEALWTFL
jgi:hypothetical protein